MLALFVLLGCISYYELRDYYKLRLADLEQTNIDLKNTINDLNSDVASLNTSLFFARMEVLDADDKRIIKK